MWKRIISLIVLCYLFNIIYAKPLNFEMYGKGKVSPHETKCEITLGYGGFVINCQGSREVWLVTELKKVREEVDDGEWFSLATREL